MSRSSCKDVFSLSVLDLLHLHSAHKKTMVHPGVEVADTLYLHKSKRVSNGAPVFKLITDHSVSYTESRAQHPTLWGALFHHSFLWDRPAQRPTMCPLQTGSLR